MRPKKRKDSGAGDLFRSRLDQIVNTDHLLAKLSRLIDWKFLEEELGSIYLDGVIAALPDGIKMCQASEC